MGYAKTSQVANGIHTRLYARAFIFEEEEVAAPCGKPRSKKCGRKERAVFVSVGTGMIGQLVKKRVTLFVFI